MSALERIVGAESAGMRLDVFVTREFAKAIETAGLSRSSMQRLILSGRVTLNDRRAKASSRLKLNDVIKIQSLPPKPARLAREAIPLDVLYEDRDCVVLNKAPGIVVHPAAAASSGTLVNALLHHCPDLEGIGGERRPGIVHRLDKETSGVMIVAKNDFAFQQLARQFKERHVSKEYLALVWGKLKSRKGIIDRPIGRHRSDRKRMSSTRSLARTKGAITEWEVESCFEIKAGRERSSWVSLLRVKPHTGRTHQIRVHLADMGYPLIGDKVYGRKAHETNGDGDMSHVLQRFGRQALHAEKLGLTHPRSGRPLQFYAPLPRDFHELLTSLRAHALSAKRCSNGDSEAKQDRGPLALSSMPMRHRVDNENGFK
jgi:23S rRNA pseudouridine1911/1915/1917 synthase